MNTRTAAWRIDRCPHCRAPVIDAVAPIGVHIRVEAQASTDGELALSARTEGAPMAYKPSPRLAFGRPLRRRHPDDCIPRDELRLPARARPGAKPVIRPHAFDPYPAEYDRYNPHDDSYPPEPYTGRLTCRTCKAVGEPGDKRHPTNDAPAGLPEQLRAAAAARDAAVLGEKEPTDE